MSKKRGKPYCYEYPRPAVTVDVVVVTTATPRRVLLIRRKNPPYQDCWALPGGFVDMDESLDDAARRELLEETGVRVKHIEQLQTFGDPHRDPRGRVISVVYLAEVDRNKVHPRAADDAADAQWHSLARPPQLAFDHAQVLAAARRRLRSGR